MSNKRKRVVGDDGELLIEAAPPTRRRSPIRWLVVILIFIVAGLFVSEWSKGPGKKPPVSYRARLAETGGAENGSCGGWVLWGAVDRDQPGMTIRAGDAAGRIYEGRVHTDIMYQIIISPQPKSLHLRVELESADGRRLSEPIGVDFSNDQCTVRVDFDGVD